VGKRSSAADHVLLDGGHGRADLGEFTDDPGCSQRGGRETTTTQGCTRFRGSAREERQDGEAERAHT
jgi:hypothetical protein